MHSTFISLVTSGLPLRRGISAYPDGTPLASSPPCVWAMASRLCIVLALVTIGADLGHPLLLAVKIRVHIHVHVHVRVLDVVRRHRVGHGPLVGTDCRRTSATHSPF